MLGYVAQTIGYGSPLPFIPCVFRCANLQKSTDFRLTWHHSHHIDDHRLQFQYSNCSERPPPSQLVSFINYGILLSIIGCERTSHCPYRIQNHERIQRNSWIQ